MTLGRRRGLVGVAVAVALLAALLVWSPWSGSSSRSDARAGGSTSTRADEAGERADDPAVDTEPAAREGGIVRLGLGGPLVVDPPYASPASPSDQMVLDLLHDGLTEVSGSGAAATVGPGLATSWTVDAALQVWRFSLDPAATFSDGRDLVAADVVASLEHVIAGGDASPAAVRLEAVRGFRDYLDGRAPTVSGLQAVDDATVEITLDLPLAQLPWILAAPAYGIVEVRSLLALGPPPAEGDDGVARSEAVPLSGGWEVSGADGDGLHLSRRQGTAAHLDGIVLRPFADGEAAYAAFVDEDVDWAPVPADHHGEAVDAFGDDAFASFQAELLLALRTSDPVLARPEVRQAIAAAIDRAAIVDAVYPEVALPLDRIVPPEVATAASELPRAPRHDAAGARRLLRAAFPDQRFPTIVIDHESSPATDALVEIVASSLDEIGLSVDVRPHSLEDQQRLLAAGRQHAFTLPWLGGYRSPDAYLDPLLRSTSPDNTVGLADPSIDAALAQARATGDPVVAAERWRAVEATALEQAYLIPIAQFRTEVVVADRVLGLRHAVDGTVDWSLVRLAA